MTNIENLNSTEDLRLKLEDQSAILVAIQNGKIKQVSPDTYKRIMEGHDGNLEKAREVYIQKLNEGIHILMEAYGLEQNVLTELSKSKEYGHGGMNAIIGELIKRRNELRS